MTQRPDQTTTPAASTSESWATRTLSRRKAVAGVGGTALAAAAGLPWLRNPTRTEAARLQATPAADFRPSLHSVSADAGEEDAAGPRAALGDQLG